MIKEALTFITDTLNDHLKDNKVILGPVSGDHQDKVIISLVNITEEATLKNVPPIRQTGIKNQHPPLALNLGVLVSAHSVTILKAWDISMRRWHSLTAIVFQPPTLANT